MGVEIDSNDCVESHSRNDTRSDCALAFPSMVIDVIRNASHAAEQKTAKVKKKNGTM